MPTVDVSGSGERSRSSGSLGSSGGGSLYGNLFSAGTDASWELDIFGGLRRSLEAASANLGAQEENLNDVLVTLLSEVAVNYVDARTYQARIAAVSGNADAQAETLKIIEWRKQAGISDELAVQEARYNLENTRSQIPPLRTSLEAAMNRIAVLLGEQPGAVHVFLKDPEGLPLVPASVAVGIPADMIRRRPDIRKAERDLAAQTARVGVAVADLYPKFTLSGALGFTSLSTGSLFSSDSRTLSGLGGVTAPVFHGGALRQNVEIQSALQEQAAVTYESTLLTALEEAENVIVAYAEEQARRDALIGAEDAAKKAVVLAEGKYEAGLTNFITVLDAQRSLLTFQNQLAESKGKVVSNLIKIYKALGGGWEAFRQGDETKLAKGEKR
jgi:outer membrane protein, multidrug efflux system